MAGAELLGGEAERVSTLQSFGGQILSVLPARGGDEGLLRAQLWFNLVHRIGMHVPLVFCHDLGRVIVEGLDKRPARNGEALARVGLEKDRALHLLLSRYEALIERLGRSEMALRAPSLKLSDEAVAALIVRVFGPVLGGAPRQSASSGESAGAAGLAGFVRHDLPLDPKRTPNLGPVELARRYGLDAERAFLQGLALHFAQVVTAAERVDVDTLRLIALFAGDASLMGPSAALELFSLLGDPAAADVIHFSMELLPQITERHRPRSLQRYAVDGVAGVSRRGNPDQLLPSELAYPDEIFFHKVGEGELLYYGHEAEEQRSTRGHLVLIDASASMRGSRAIFARGLALALLRRLVAREEAVELRFFDSALYEPVEIRAHDFQIPYLLSFHSERGRNMRRVFSALLEELRRRRRLNPQALTVTLLTHGQCFIPRALVEAISGLAGLYGVFVLADPGIALDYLPLLEGYRFIQREDLVESGTRKKRALELVERLTGDPR